MIEKITDPKLLADAGSHLGELVSRVTLAPFNRYEEQKRYTDMERTIHASFKNILRDSVPVASQRFHAGAGTRQWVIDAYQPITLNPNSSNMVRAIPYIKKGVVTWEYVTRTTKDAWVMTPTKLETEKYKEEAIGFLITTGSVEDSLQSTTIARPWERQDDAQVGKVERDSPDRISSLDLVVTPVLEENQRRFRELLTDLQSL